MRGDTSFQTKAAGWILAGCGLVAVIVITAITSSPDNALGAGLLFAGLLAGGFLSVLVHELGHAIGAWAVGWRVWIISVTGIVVRLGHAPRFSTKYTRDVGGYVLGSPPDIAHDSRWRSIVFSAGGPLASLLTGPLFIFWLTTLPRDGLETPTGAGLLGAVLAFGVASTSSALLTLWPMRGRGGRPNDMGMILDTLFFRPPASDTSGVAWAWALLGHGVEPSAWPRWMRESIARAAATPWGPPTAPLLAFFAALDADDEPAARRVSRGHAHELGSLMRAFVAAYFDRNAQAAATEIAGISVDPNDPTLTLLYMFITGRVAALNSYHDAAAHTYAGIANDLRIDAPKPFWEKLLTRYGP
ncbi:MAG: hypothetical protein R3C30_08785 [Hyphomonadaceae bacterium]